MTDREVLLSLKSIIDAQLGTNVIPVLPVDTPPAQPLPTPASTPASNLKPFQVAMLGGNPLPTGQGGPPPANVDPPPLLVNRWSRAFDFVGGSLRFWSGNAGSVISTFVPVPQGWHGTVLVKAAESSAAGVKVNQFDVWVSATQGGSGVVLLERGSECSATVPVPDGQPFYVNVRPYTSGGGLVEIHPNAS